MLWLFHSLLHLELLQHVTECNGMTLRLCPMAFLVLSVSSTGSKVNIDRASFNVQQLWVLDPGKIYFNFTYIQRV